VLKRKVKIGLLWEDLQLWALSELCSIVMAF